MSNPLKFLILKRKILSVFKELEYDQEYNFSNCAKIIEEDNHFLLQNLYSNRDVKKGVCSDLTDYLYHKIQSDLPDYISEFKIKAVSGQEPMFFNNYSDLKIGHIFLTCYHKKTYVIDPSFKVFKPIDDTDYIVDSNVNPAVLRQLNDSKLEIPKTNGGVNIIPLKYVNKQLVLFGLQRYPDLSIFIIAKKRKTPFRILYQISKTKEINKLKGITQRNEKTPLIYPDVEFIIKEAKRLFKTFK